MKTNLAHATTLDFMAFFIGLGMAYFLHWSTRDLIWSLWLSSLVIGSASLLATIAAGVYIAWHVVHRPDFPVRYRSASLLLISLIALLFIGFFALHFGAFHAGHASFLLSFFPLENIPENTFTDAFMNPVLLAKIAATYIVPLYGLFLIPMLLSERNTVFGILGRAIHFVKSNIFSDAEWSKQLLEALLEKKDKKEWQKFFYQPYVNVIRMHLLILFLAFIHSYQLDSFALYALVYAVYFLPWKALSKMRAA